MPPLKKFKSGEGNAHSPNPFAPGHHPIGSNGMHETIMNGPTLSPQGQLPPPSHQRNQMPNGAPPPGLRSPLGPPAYSKGYNQYVGQQNGYNSNLQRFSHIEPPSMTRDEPIVNGAGGEINKQTNPGLSASSSLSQPPLPQYQTSQYPPSGSPYLNSFPRQLPSSSHAIHNTSSPSQSNHQPTLPTFSPQLHSNGSPLQQPPSHSPIKQQSSPPPQPTLNPYSTPTPTTPQQHPRP